MRFWDATPREAPYSAGPTWLGGEAPHDLRDAWAHNAIDDSHRLCLAQKCAAAILWRNDHEQHDHKEHP